MDRGLVVVSDTVFADLTRRPPPFPDYLHGGEDRTAKKGPHPGIRERIRQALPPDEFDDGEHGENECAEGERSADQKGRHEDRDR